MVFSSLSDVIFRVVWSAMLTMDANAAASMEAVAAAAAVAAAVAGRTNCYERRGRRWNTLVRGQDPSY